MINEEKSVCLESSVWDLHIHSCRCKKSSGDFRNLPIADYFNLLASIFASHSDLKMISFTDHNSIDPDIYKTAFSMSWNISVIIGVEVDTFLDNDYKNANDIKHVIYYFDPEKFNIDKHCELINNELSKGPVLLVDFLNFLVTDIKVPFLISPHFMKQDKRGIDFNWTDESFTKNNIDKYIDQMFCFWETSSSINIHKAQQFLKDFDRDSKVSIIAFSDSSCKSKLEEYLNNPHQFFNALPSFEGMRMVGSDVRRISFHKEFIKSQDKPLFIGRVKQGESNQIIFSNKLNAVIGGRGTGKSLLIDGISLCLNRDKLIEREQTKDRLDYLSSLNYEVYDLNGNRLNGHDFKFEYFNQGYVLNLFKNNKDDALGNIYFKDEFSSLEEFDQSATKEAIKQELLFERVSPQNVEENLASICEKIQIFDDKDDVNYFKKEKESKVIDYPNLENALSALSKPAILPAELKENKNIKVKGLELLETIYKEVSLFNVSTIKNSFYSRFYSKYSELLSEKTESKKEKRKTLKLLSTKLNNKFVPILNRVSRMNCFINLTKDYSDKRSKSVNGYGNNKFTFARELHVQPILEYLHYVFCCYFDKNKISTKLHLDRDALSSLPALINIYCYYPEEYLLQSKSLADLDYEFDNLSSLKIEAVSEVYYSNNEGISEVKLRNQSPGTKANILMEYIVFKQTSIPLLIDQPEDNIDNKTIYKDLTEWFNSLKNKRQVIVATHDANIVVNSDAENIIVCNQVQNDVFDYKNGALEYGTIIDDVSTILDGGKDALVRRLAKYGKTD